MLCLCALLSVLSCVLCAIHSFVNRENVQFAPHLSRSLCLFLLVPLSFALNLAVCMCACTQRAAIILWIFIYVFFFAQRQTIKMLTTKNKKMWKSKKAFERTFKYTECLYMMWPAASFHSSPRGLLSLFSIVTFEVVVLFLFSSLTNCELFEMKQTFIHHCITMHFKSKCSSGRSSSHCTGNYSIYYYFERLFISIFNIERIESTKNWINK